MNLDDNKARGLRAGAGFIIEGMDIVPADNYQLTFNHPQYIRATPAGAIDILMPTSSPDKKGHIFIVKNLGGATITFKTDGDAAFTTALSAATTVLVRLICTGNPSQVLGWEFW
jgi:hypothetical protein